MATPLAQEQEQVLEAFNKFDSDGSGCIDREELSAVLKALGGGLDNAAVNSLLQQADASGDGVLSVQEFVRWVFAEDQLSVGLKHNSGFTFVISGCSRKELNGEYVQQDKFYCRRPVFYCAENKRVLFYQKQRGAWGIYWKPSMKFSARVKTKRAPHALQEGEAWAVWKTAKSGKKGFVKEPSMCCTEPPELSAEERVAKAPLHICILAGEFSCDLEKKGLEGERPCYEDGEGFRCFYHGNHWHLENNGTRKALSYKTSVFSPHLCFWEDQSVQVTVESPDDDDVPESTEKWEDPDFPATDDSIGPEMLEYNKRWEPTWKRLSDIYKEEMCLFNDDDPFDCDQGCMGNCWLVGIIASMGEFGSWVTDKLFQSKEVSSSGRYDIRIYDPKIRDWATFSIDDRVPYSKKLGRPLFMNSRGSIWSLLLEKFFAKYCGCYSALDARQRYKEKVDPTEAMCMLTGSDILGHCRKNRTDRNLWLVQRDDLEVTAERDPKSEVKGKLWLWARIYEEELCGKRMRYAVPESSRDKEECVNVETGWITKPAHRFRLSVAAGWTFTHKQLGPDKDWYKAACCNQKELEKIQGIDTDLMWQKLVEFDKKSSVMSLFCPPDWKSDTGIVRFHAYSLLGLFEVEGFKMCCIRNAWGHTEWTGSWSDGSDEWDEHPEVAKALCNEVEDDGVFWMEWTDFLSCWCEICINVLPEPMQKRSLFHSVLDDEDQDE